MSAGAIQGGAQVGVERRQFLRRRLLAELDVGPEPLLRLVVREGHGALGGRGRLVRVWVMRKRRRVGPATSGLRAVGDPGGDPRSNGSIAAMSRARVIPAVDHLLGLPDGAGAGSHPRDASRATGARREDISGMLLHWVSRQHRYTPALRSDGFRHLVRGIRGGASERSILGGTGTDQLRRALRPAALLYVQ